MSRDGKMYVWEGIWLSTAVMLPLGIFVTYKAVGDSAVFNVDAYAAFFNRLRGKRPKRSLTVKEVVITEVDPHVALGMIGSVDVNGKDMRKMTNDINTLVDYLSNSRDHRVIQLLNKLPFKATRRTLPVIRETLAALRQCLDQSES